MSPAGPSIFQRALSDEARRICNLSPVGTAYSLPLDRQSIREPTISPRRKPLRLRAIA